MYGKFFASTYTGSMIASGAEVFAVWGYVISHAVSSTVELNPRLLAAVIGSTPDRMKAAIEKLCEPDPESRSKEEEGRRLIREGEFQYRVVNHDKYRNIRDEEGRREYNRIKKQEQRDRERAAKEAAEASAKHALTSTTVNDILDSQPIQKQIQHTEEESSSTVVVAVQPEKSPVESKKRPSKKAPASFLVDAALQQWAREHVPGLNIRAETEKFRDHTFSRCISDWPGAWRNWMRKAFTDLGHGKGTRNPPSDRKSRQLATAALMTGSVRTGQEEAPQQEIFDVESRVIPS